MPSGVGLVQREIQDVSTQSGLETFSTRSEACELKESFKASPHLRSQGDVSQPLGGSPFPRQAYYQRHQMEGRYRFCLVLLNYHP